MKSQLLNLHPSMCFWILMMNINIAERAVDLAAKVGGKAIPLSEVGEFHPEDGMVLANATSVGMKPKVDESPIPKVCLCALINLQTSINYEDMKVG